MSSAEREGQRTLSNITLKEVDAVNYTCAYYHRILLQGRLYMLKDKMCFRSYFNSKTIVGELTVVLIPHEDILKVQKKKYALFFNNSISMLTKKGELFFASFINRKKTYRHLLKVLDKPDEDSEGELPPAAEAQEQPQPQSL